MTTSRPRLFGLVIPVVLAVAGIILSVWGWYDQAPGQVVLLDVIYKALRSVGLSDNYAQAANWQLQAARGAGVIVAFWTVIGVTYAGFRAARLRLTAHGRSDHAVIVGTTFFARRLAQVLAAGRLKTVHLHAGAPVEATGKLISLPWLEGDVAGLETAGASKARRLVVALDDDARVTELAVAAQKRYPHLAVTARLADPWLALHLHTLPGAEKVRAFTEAGAAAREILRRHPPFLLAQDEGQTRLHALIVGDHDWLEALMVETILTACTLTYGKPAFTFVCLDPENFRARLLQRYPDLDAAADITCLPAARDAHAPLSPAEPAEIAALRDVTAVYCALGDEARSLTSALALRDLLAGMTGFTAPIFVRAGGLARPVAASRLAPGTLVPFGAPDDIARATGLLSLDGDAIEKAWHKAYLAMAPGDQQASRPWADLPEEFRVSNQRAVAHMFAKLFEAGFDLRPWLAAHDPWAQLPTLAKGEKLFRSEAERTRLAELEHERWSADRRMSGWRGGPVRDNSRKIHDNIAPFDDLSDEVKSYDYRFVDLLASILKPARDGLKRSKT